jgi:hypothetical protein
MLKIERAQFVSKYDQQFTQRPFHIYLKEQRKEIETVNLLTNRWKRFYDICITLQKADS